MSHTKAYKSAIHRHLITIFLMGIFVGVSIWSYVRHAKLIALSPTTSVAQPEPSDSPQDQIDKVKMEFLSHYEYGSGSRIPPKYIEKELHKGSTDGRYLDNLFAVHLDGYDQKTSDEVIQRYTVADDLSILPWFDDLHALDTAKPSDDLQFTIPGTRHTLRVPSSYTVELNKDGLHLSSSPLTQLAYICTDRESPYCIEMRKVWGTRITTLASQYTSVTTRTVEWSGDIYAWITDHTMWQGSTEREWVARGKPKADYQTVIAGKTYNKIGLGCCGDISYSYITKGTSTTGAPLLIIFTSVGSHRWVTDTPEHVAPNLEMILRTLRTM